MCSQCGWDYEADDTEEETDMNDRSISALNDFDGKHRDGGDPCEGNAGWLSRDCESPSPISNDRSTINIPKLRNIYQSGEKLPPLSNEGVLDAKEVSKRADLYWEKQRAKDFKRGWRQAHPKPLLSTRIREVFYYFLVIVPFGIVAAIYWLFRGAR